MRMMIAVAALLALATGAHASTPWTHEMGTGPFVCDGSVKTVRLSYPDAVIVAAIALDFGADLYSTQDFVTFITVQPAEGGEYWVQSVRGDRSIYSTTRNHAVLVPTPLYLRPRDTLVLYATCTAYLTNPYFGFSAQTTRGDAWATLTLYGRQ